MKIVDHGADTCPDENALGAYAGTRPGSVPREEVVEHLARCARCRGLVALVARQSDSGCTADPPLLPDRIAALGGIPAPPPAPPPRGRGGAALLLVGAVAVAAGLAAWIALGRGGSHAASEDPAAAEAVRAVLSRVGLVPAEPSADPPAVRVAPGLLPIGPRGALRAAPAEVVLWAAAPVQRARVVVSEDGAPDAAPLARWEVAHAVRGLRLAVPREAVFRPGGRYLVRAFDREGSTVASAAFRILSTSEAADLAREEARVDALFPEGSAEREFARAELTLARGLAGEAEAAAERLAARFPGRREPARLGLAALEALGLAGSSDWSLRRAAYEAGR